MASLADMPRLVAALGHEPLWEELPCDIRRVTRERGVRAAATVGRRGTFTWLGLDAESPAAAARRAAERLSGEGRLAGVWAVDPATRRLAVAVAFGETGVLALDAGAPAPLAVASLRRLAGIDAAGGAAFAVRAADALAARGVGTAFFRQFRDTLDAMANSLAAVPVADRRPLALLQLTRVLFLYFVQSKGWLDGRPDFLARQADRCLGSGGDIDRRLLRPLFFGALNRPASERTIAVRALGRIPFLNGGLFEPHAIERRHRAAVPDGVWRSAIDELFERFHFTVSEGNPDGPAVAPDMLGRVFEGVMDRGERRAGGAFYTPAALVDRIVGAGLAALVGSRLGCSDDIADRRLAERDPAAVAVAADAAVLDPAVGSGAFLLGALDRLATLRNEPTPYAARRAVLRRSLFGVDLDPMAVRLAELRLWLAVVADDPADGPAGVRPLPNLDALVRQGDSLLEPAGVPSAWRPERELGRRVGALRARIVVATGSAKRRLARELRGEEARAARAALDDAERRVERRVEELLDAARAPSLFGDRAPLGASRRATLAGLRAELRAVRAARRRLVRDGAVPWFHYESHFADVAARGGFDLVVGNPPWVRAEQLPVALRERLAARYSWWRSLPAAGFAHRPDLSVAFLERAHRLAAPGGAVAMLLPAKVATAGYGAAARGALSRERTIHAVADLTAECGSAFDATVYPLALVTTMRAPAARHAVREQLHPAAEAAVPQRLLGSGPWVISGSRAARASSALREAHPAFGERFRCRLGVKTGADRIFLDPPSDIEACLLRRALRGRDISAFRIVCPRRLLWPLDERGAPLVPLPPAAARYLRPHDAALRARADYAGGMPWALFRTGSVAAPHRIVWPDVARRMTAAALTGAGALDVVPLNTCYVAVAASAAAALAACAWLNGTVPRAIAAQTASAAAGGFRRFTAATVAAIPFPSAADADPALAALATAAGEGQDVLSALDDRIAVLLGLDAADRAALEAVALDGAHDRR